MPSQCIVILEEEKTGRTTRLVDEYVQKYFTEPLFTPIIVKDHVDDYRHNVELLDRLRKRLEREFGEGPYYDDKAIMYNLHYVRFRRDGTENTYCVIIRTKDRIQNARNEAFRMYVQRLEDIDREFEGKDLEIINHKPSLAEALLFNRANGRSTRLADEYIQKYFDLKPGEYIEIIDHYGGEGERRAHEDLAKRIADRLKEEHGEKFYFHRASGYPRIVRVEK